MRALLATALSLLLLNGCAAKHMITGTVVDRNGQPVPRAIVSLSPGGVELVTNREGGFLIDYLRDPQGRRVPIERRTDYTIEVLKPGYHKTIQQFYFRRGSLSLEAMTLLEDTIEVGPSEGDLDPGSYRDRTHSDGSNYEGE